MSQIQVTGEAKIRDLQGPVVANSGVITALDGLPSQYVRGDGTLADIPSVTGGGASVSYYLNGSVNQGTFGGSTYYQLGENAITGVGTNFSTSTDGLLAQFITDVNVPDVTEIPSGNWNIEFYMGVSASSGALASFYAELYKYDGTTFTLIASSVGTPEILTNTTTVSAYFSSIAVPQTTLLETDRIAIRVYASVAGKTVTLYTEDNRLCQVVTTFSRGMLSLNSLTDQQQYLTVGTAGTDFNIVSAVDTHTFNIPSASATNRGLITTGTQTIAGSKTFTDPTLINNRILIQNGAGFIKGNAPNAFSLTQSNVFITSDLGDKNLVIQDIDTSFAKLQFQAIGDYDYTFPALSGTLALTSNLSSYVPYTGATGPVNLGIYSLSSNGLNIFGSSVFNANSLYQKAGLTAGGLTDYITVYHPISGNGVSYYDGTSLTSASLVFDTTGSRTYTFPASSGTVALTSNLSAYVPYTGATGPVDLGSYDLLVNGVRAGKGGGTGSNNTRFGALAFMANTTGSYNAALGTLTLNANTTGANNTAVGNAALQLNTTGGSNTSVGAFTLTNNTTGVGNVALGTGSLAGITTGSYNIAIGINTANLITTGDFNTIIGNYSGSTNLTSNIILADGAGNVRYQWNGTNNVFGNAVQASAYRLTGMTAGSGALYWTSDRVTLANYNASGVVHIEANGGVGVATFGGATYNNDFVGTGRFTGALSGTSATFSGNFYVSGGTNTNVGNGIHAYYESNYAQLQLNGVDGSIIDFSTSGTDFKGRILYNNSSNSFSFNTNGAGTPALTIASTGAATFSSSVTATNTINVNGGGDVGINISSSAGAYTGYLNINSAGGGASVIRGIGGTPFLFEVGGAERMRITSGGNVGIGTSSPVNYTNYRSLHISGAASNSSAILYLTNSTESIRGLFFAEGSANRVTIGSQSNHDFTFLTNDTERMRITSGGNVLIGTTTDAGYKLDVNGTGRFSGGNLRFDNLSNSIFRGIVFGATPADATEYAYIKYQPSAGHFRIFGSPAGFGGLTTFENNGIQWLQVNTNNTLNFTGATTFNSSVTATGFFESSDKRIKKEITDNPTIKGIESIKPKLYVKAEKEELGYYAQDLQEVLPSAVTEGSDGFLSLSYAQVHTAKIAQLETEVAELKELIKKLL